ncbi:Predicted Zn-dependent protease [Chryseobacterium carnipullorum]|uniref:DUF2268 domain-containing putative Zn-dependent protease n=1 Tax=Chryseobacterium carnipullorum TaxID=1124835 RepID=UPI00091A2D89|nr:DUF2268 domain-containing putative Zn-dependent protease [Chryseobacterium carnipullorum]SHM23435.1 Predicted Zn-dependent protease [Chryseobacterium carnipullorum]
MTKELPSIMKKIFLLTISVLLFSCIARKKDTSDFDFRRIEKVADSIKIQNITVHNLFKSQILAHRSKDFDSTMIVSKVYLPHRKLWDSCYGAIFGEDNGKMFNNEKGMMDWNRTLLEKEKSLIVERTNLLLKLNIDKLLKTNLKKFNRLVPESPTAKMSIVLTPFDGIGFGGCNFEQFALELNNKSLDIDHTLNKGLPHELNHLVYEKYRNKRSDKDTALSQTIDEGFACYFTYIFFDRKITPYEAVENMSKAEWEWFMKHEKEIYTKNRSYFSDKSGDNPLLRNDKLKIFPDAPKSLYYWLGFRIISKYVEKYGADSWKDIYKLTPEEVLAKSEYESYIENL